MSSSFKNTRRGFIKTTAALGVGYWVAGRATAEEGAPAAKPAEAPSEKLNFACIGVGGKGDSDRTMPDAWATSWRFATSTTTN